MAGDTAEVTPTPTRGVPVMLDKKRHLRFSLKTMRELREKFGENALETGLDQDAIATLLWYGLRHEDPELTPELVEDMVDLEQLTEVMQAVFKATGTRGRLELTRDTVESAQFEEKVDEKDLSTDEGVAAKIQEQHRPPQPASTEEPEKVVDVGGEPPEEAAVTPS